MTLVTIRMGGLSRFLRIKQDGPDSSLYEMSMAGYYPHTFKAESLGDAVNVALVSIGKMRRDEQARARAEARGKKLQETLRAKKSQDNEQPVKAMPKKPEVKAG